MTIPEIDLTKSEEKAFRQIVLGEPDLARRPLTGWTGVFVVVGVFLLYGLVSYWLLSIEPEPLSFGVFFVLLFLISLTQRRELETGNKIIRKLYRILEQRAAETGTETGTGGRVEPRKAGRA
jgi:hypothetical protein